ncbi:MAG: DNA polymerase IV [Clostridia bacterium]|nr:DNA polymerase IV [Clostridia bacterium]
MKRVILHCDCNNFFASVEAALNPAYRDVPFAVCGSAADRRGIVLAKNYIAKSYGIKTAETVYSAKQKCKDLVIGPPHHELYAEYSKRVNEIYSRYTDMIEPFGIDESWLDVTASRKLFGDGEQIANLIREDVKREIGITVSVGVSFNKIFAKLGSDYKKPDAVTVISEENFREIVFPLPVQDLLFIGAKTEKELRLMGIRTIGALAATSPEILTSKFGKAGAMLHKYANGLDDSPVAHLGEHADAKSVGSGLTFRHNLVGREECKIGISHLSEEVARRLRAQGMKCATVQLGIKDEYLRTIQRQRPASPETDLAKEISDIAMSILTDEWPERKPIRMLTVTASNLVHSNMLATQIDMFGEDKEQAREKNKKMEETIDKIRQKYGDDSIINGAIIDTDLGIYEPKPRPERPSDKQTYKK